MIPRPPQLDRLPQFVAAPPDARRRLARLRVLLAGAGSVGGAVAERVARAGVAAIGVVDPKAFSGSFATQPLRGAGDVGAPKAPRVASWLKAIAPATEVPACVGRLQDLPWAELDRYDVILASTDLIGAEIEIGQVARRLGKPLIAAAVHGPTLTAQVRVFGNDRAAAPCPACGLSAAERAQVDAERRFSCDPGAAPEETGPPTASIAPLCGLAADLAVLELYRLALGLGPAPADTVLQHNAYRHETTVAPLHADGGCPCDHAVFERACCDGAPAGMSLREIASAAGVDPAEAGTALAVDGFRFAWTGTCGRCGAELTLNRFVDRNGAGARPCSACGAAAVIAEPFFCYGPFVAAGQGLDGLLDVPLAELDAAGAAAVAVRGGDRTVLVQERSPG